MRREAGLDRGGVKLMDVRVGDDRVAMGRRVRSDQLARLADEAGLDVDLGLARSAYD